MGEAAMHKDGIPLSQRGKDGTEDQAASYDMALQVPPAARRVRQTVQRTGALSRSAGHRQHQD